MDRLQGWTTTDLRPLVALAFSDTPDPDMALTNLERWLRACSSPETQLQHLAATPDLASLLVLMFGSGQHLADLLIQNPELAYVVSDPGTLSERPTRSKVEAEGRSLLKTSSSFTHALDRLRFLRQRWQLAIVVNDLASLWTPEEVWRAISDTADALLTLAWETVVTHHELPPVPVGIVGFGKLGGQELNYSSDVDLVYFHADGASEHDQRAITRLCEVYGRALGDRMGRGSLYRVDLRLRPYGGTGPIVRSLRSIRKYYELHAEPWERQALIRSRVIVGEAELGGDWEALRVETCFPSRLSEPAYEQMVGMRNRIEEYADDADLKRGAGGIRDVEFVVQALQMLVGHRRPEAQVRPTLLALQALVRDGAIDVASAQSLEEGYRFLRQLEHRCQLVGDQQTHSIPNDPRAREHLARLMGLPDWAALDTRLRLHQRAVRSVYEEILGGGGHREGAREAILQLVGPQASSLRQWFDVLPDREAYYESLRLNEGSLRRVQTMLTHAPVLIGSLKSLVPTTENILSGEIEEEDPGGRLSRLALDAPPEAVALALRTAWTTLHAKWVLDPVFPLHTTLSEVYDHALAYLSRRFEADFDILALGSYASHDLAPRSDLDLLLLVSDPKRQPEAERQAQRMLAFIATLRRSEAPLHVDLRLRPEGGKGLLVRTYDGFRAYELEAMELWERFALGRSRLVLGDLKAERLARHASYALPITPERLNELIAMKRRIESERVQPSHASRNVKLGRGALLDIEWFVQLMAMRYPSATEAERFVRMEDRLARLAAAGLINAVELEELLVAHAYFVRMRTRLALLGVEDDLLPENPDKLNILARSEGLPDGNALLGYHERATDVVRGIYEDGLVRLGGETR